MSGTRAALQTTSEIEALRRSLLAPIAGLALAFGTSLSGVATSLILGLASTLTRRAELRLHQRIAGLCPGPQSPLHPVTRQTVALEDLVEQGVVLPKLLAEFREAVGGLGKTFEEGRLGQERLGNHIASLISEQLGILRGDLGLELKRFSDHFEPALKGFLVHAVGLLDDTGQDLMSKVQARIEATSTYDQERRNAFLQLIESERRTRGSEEAAHFERLTVHAEMFSDALHGHVQAIGSQYSSYLAKLEERMAAFDEAWRTDSAGRRQYQEAERRAFETHLEEMRRRFIDACEEEARRHHGLLEHMASQYHDLVEGFGKQTSALADQAAKAVAEVSALHSGILEKHEGDREQMRKAWGVEQGRQQRQFDALLEKMREDLDDRRRSGAEQIVEPQRLGAPVDQTRGGRGRRQGRGLGRAVHQAPRGARRGHRGPAPRGTRTHARIQGDRADPRGRRPASRRGARALDHGLARVERWRAAGNHPMNTQPLDPDSDGMDTTPAWYIWPAIADIMVCLLGIFVLLFVWSTVLQIEIEAKLKSEQEARQAEAKRLQVLEQALAKPVAEGPHHAQRGAHRHAGQRVVQARLRGALLGGKRDHPGYRGTARGLFGTERGERHGERLHG